MYSKLGVLTAKLLVYMLIIQPVLYIHAALEIPLGWVAKYIYNVHVQCIC